MAETEQKLADCVGAIYEAVTGTQSWQPVDSQLGEIMDAQSVLLNLVAENGNVDSLMPIGEADAVYASYYHRIDPYVARARADYTDNRNFHIGRALPGEALVPDRAFIRSEYYNDFASRYERRYMIGGLLGVEQVAPLGLYRGSSHRPFENRDIQILQILLPHFQRALELRARLGQGQRANWMSQIALEALPIGIVIVDAGLRIRFVNQVGQAQIAAPGSALCSVRSGPFLEGDKYVRARSRRENADLHSLVEAAANGGSGGSMRAMDEGGLPWALLVSPTPARLVADDAGPGLGRGLALIVFQPLHRKAIPPVDLLCDVFGFSRAEAQVATALSGGVSAEGVAQRRGVSLVTVRGQIRSILGKSECENLRDFERAMAMLATIKPREDPMAD